MVSLLKIGNQKEAGKYFLKADASATFEKIYFKV